MPRRPAPTALHLVKGPSPARGEPRHTLPAPPQPVFQPKMITKPRSSSTASRSRVDAPLLTFVGPDPTDKSSVDGVMFESPIERGYIPQWDANPVAVTGASRRAQPGPWDRTRINALPQERMTGLIAVPKPVVANPAPLCRRYKHVTVGNSTASTYFRPKMFSFGSAAAKPATTGFGGSLFGQANTTQATPATTGGLFGAGANTSGQPGNAPTTTATNTGGLFGSTQPAAGTSTATTGSGLFGTQQPTTTATTGGLFGAQPAATTATTAPTGGLFGAQPAASAPTGAGLFGAQTGANAAAGTTGSSFGFGASAAAPAPAQPAAQASGPFTRTTKFNDLPDAQKKVFEEIERVQISVELKAQKLGEEIAKEQAALDELTRSLSAASSALSSDRLAADDQRTKTDRNLQDALIATRIIDGFTKPQQMGGYLTSYANFPLEYFTRQVEEMKERVQRYKSTVEQIERKLAQVYEANSAQPAQPSPQAIANALRAQHASFMALAARTAEIDAAVRNTRPRIQRGGEPRPDPRAIRLRPRVKKTIRWMR
ncbi:nucleoporin FG repeat region [Rhizoctonia solani]|uniref:Nucleoporin FG repeat region n=1 Tax=Rhizoctonia solani TaxID=456999 RepID=A0A8H8NQU0_9AGAM|nr:nucleoporin FG repeat region [Rhizoctonia solani]QRW17815.1 nucleoporin FG repeat region [Rhizoctonia solani]